MKGNIDWKRLARHFAGVASPKEERELNAWIKADPSRRLWVEQLRRIWELSEKAPEDSQPFSAETDADWKRLRERMEPSGPMESSRPMEPSGSPESFARAQTNERGRRRASRVEGRPPVVRRRERGGRSQRHPYRSWREERSWAKKGIIAAVVCLLVAGAVFFGSSVMEEPGESASAASMREVTTEPGERAKIRMTDGTEVTLNVDSRLRLPAGAAGDSVRRVFLRGEAYFDVASSERPFVVHVREATVNVHGTVFDVRSYPEEQQVQVAVAEGNVSLHPDQDASSGTRLTSGQVGRLNEEKRLVATEEVDVKSYLAWRDGQIVFEDAPLPVVARRLGRWYDLTFEIEDASLEALHLTARLNSSSVRDVMDVIAATLGIRYEMRDDRVVLKKADDRSASSASEKKMRTLRQDGPGEVS